MPKFDNVGYILIHKDTGNAELLPNPWEWPKRQEQSRERRLINWLTNWLTGQSPDSH